MILCMNTPLWDNHAWDTLPAFETETSADLCVIGLGGSGLAAILEALKNGADVIGIDAHDVGAGAAGRNGGFVLAGLKEFYHEVVNQLGRSRAAPMYAATLEEILRLRELTPNAVRHTGSLRIAQSSDELEDCALQLAALQKDDFPAEQYQGSEGIGILFPQDCAMNPLARVRDLARLVQQKGARLFGQTRATTIESGMVQGEHFRIRAKKTIVAIDGKLEQIFQNLLCKFVQRVCRCSALLRSSRVFRAQCMRVLVMNTGSNYKTAAWSWVVSVTSLKRRNGLLQTHPQTHYKRVSSSFCAKI